MELPVDEARIKKVCDISKENFPQVALFERRPEQPEISNLQKNVRSQLRKLSFTTSLNPDVDIGITAGSRGITNIGKILRYVVEYLKSENINPFIFPSMGSHGGATAKGQVEVLQSLGITGGSMGCPIKATMETVEIGETKGGLSVMVDKQAYQADGVLVVNRVKPHTAFHGRIESGLTKMIAIGMGNQRGARMAHKQGFSQGLGQIIPEVAKIVKEKLTILGGLALVENFYDRTAIIEGIEPPNFIDREKELLAKSKSLMPKLPTDQIDVLIVNEMGKDVSGTGMDTNIIGRYMVLGVRKTENPSISRIYVRGLTEASHGNATGLGLADFTHQRLLEKVNLTDTYVNILNGTGPEKGRIPPCFSKDLTGLQACFASIAPSPEKTRLLWIKNTMELSKFYASKPLIHCLDSSTETTIKQEGEWMDFSFNEEEDFTEHTYKF